MDGCNIHFNDCLHKPIKNFFVYRCEADPAALSKYVIALIKKEKPLDELKVSMQEQVHDQALLFVNKLFLIKRVSEKVGAQLCTFF